MPKLRCTICERSLLVEKFRFFVCGHGLCEFCLERTSMEPTCAYCRRKKERPHQVFLNFSEATIDDNASNVADGLDRIDANSPAISLERAGRKVRNITKYVNEDTATYLLEAVRNLNERVLPLSAMLEVERAGNATCRKQIADLEGKLKLTESLDVEVARLRARLGEAERNYETAACLAEKANKRAEARKEENERLRESLERHRYALKSKDEETDITKAELEKKKNQVHLLNTKLKALSKSGNRPRIRTRDMDASLSVETPDTEGMVDLEVDLDGPPKYQLKTRTNLPNPRSKKRKTVAAVTVGG